MKPQLIYVLFGSDRFTRDEQVRGLRRRMLAEPCGEYNLSVLTGDDVTIRDIRAVADTLPFMTDRRLVIVEGLLGRLAGQTKGASRRARTTRASGAKAPPKSADEGPTVELVKFLADLPNSTALVFVEDKIDPALVEGWLPPDRAHIRGYERPRPNELGRWIERRAKHHEGRIEVAAVRQLAQLAPEDLGLLDTELQKLITYADGRPVTLEDVELLSASPEVNVFGLLDAIAAGDRGPALAQLRRLLQRGERPEAMVPLIAGSLRRLIEARELLDQGVRGAALATRLGMQSWQAERTERQARRHRVEELEGTLRRLLRADQAIKTGLAEPELALELFICDLPRVS